MDRANVVIIGGGVVGCALACEIAAQTEDVFLLEQMPKLGMATSTRNSGVVHSGIYYAPGSLKARLCVSGNILTKEFCAAHGVPHNNCGKLVIASHDSEIHELEKLAANGRANGVEDLRLVDRARIREREPHIAAVAALEVPSTGIVEAEALVKAYARIAVDRGANILNHARVIDLQPGQDSIVVMIEIGDPADPASLQRESIEARCVVNSAGLYADEIAALLGNTGYRIYPVRGEYAEVQRSRAHLVNALVYPLPHPGGLTLGVHLTRTMWGTILVGPSATYVAEKTDYEHNRLPLEEFLHSARTLLPELQLEDMHLAYSGLRPKLAPPEHHGLMDFVITRDPVHSRAIQLIGIESPGLTAALAIARHVTPMVAETLA